MPAILATWDDEIGGLWFQASLDKKQDPSSKITRAKRAGGMAQVKHKTLTSNSITTRTKIAEPKTI
jgi:hypothetical protein